MKAIDRIGAGHLLVLWAVSSLGWLMLYGATFNLRERVEAPSANEAWLLALVGARVVLAIVPLLLMALTWSWLVSEAVSDRVRAWHAGQLALTWFAGGFMAVVAYGGFRQLGGGPYALGLLYLFFFLGFSSLAVPSFLTLRWCGHR